MRSEESESTYPRPVSYTHLDVYKRQVDEGIQLRRHGIAKPVIILGKCHESRFEEIVTYGLEPAVFQFSQAERLSEVALRFAAKEAGTAGRVKRAGETETAGETGTAGEVGSTGSARGKAGIQLALDTGMGRIGFRPDGSAADEVQAISRLPGVEIRGMFTHFARADETDKSHTAVSYTHLSLPAGSSRRDLHPWSRPSGWRCPDPRPAPRRPSRRCPDSWCSHPCLLYTSRCV